MGTKRETERLVAWLQGQGYGVERNRKGHWHVRYRGKYLQTIPGTPGDARSYLNTVSQLRKSGIPVPRKGEEW